MSDQWNFGVERELDSNTVANLNYVGMVSHRLDVGGFYNTALTPGPGDPQSAFALSLCRSHPYDHAAGYANYNALQASVVRRFSQGWSYSVAYTWSKTMNVGTDGWYGSEGGVPQDPYAPACLWKLLRSRIRPHECACTEYALPGALGKRTEVLHRQWHPGLRSGELADQQYLLLHTRSPVHSSHQQRYCQHWKQWL